MSIERLIYGSFPLGIESDRAGYQELTYTRGYPAIRDANKNIHGRIITTYKAPETICYTDWYQDKLVEENAIGNEQIRLANEASQMSTNYHPASLTYYSETVNDCTKYVFVYGKGMIDWSMRGGIASYHSAVICDSKDITRYPILYCGSPVVCCDIMREDLFPDNGSKIPTPALLGELSSLEGKNDLTTKHTAGFNPIEFSDVISFIREGDNLNILKSMISSLIQLKSGDTTKRIVIADKSENIPIWIAAISFAFPLSLAFTISFSTYSYAVNELDITGVFVAELNGAKKISDDIEVTGYNFSDLNQSYSVYDFSLQQLGENVQMYDNLFMSIIENSFTINVQILDQFKSYIDSTTSYNSINMEYMDGAILFMFMMKDKRLSSMQMASALTFSKKYSSKAEKRRIVDKLLHLYKNYLSDSESINIVIDYIRSCVAEDIIRQTDIENTFLNDVKISFIDYESTSFDVFSEQGKIAEKFCGYGEGQLEVAFVKSIGLDSLKNILKALHEKGDVQRISYIHTSIAHYVAVGQGSYKNGRIESDIECKILDVFITGDSDANETRLETLNKKTEQIIANPISMFLYYDTVFCYLARRKFANLAKNVVRKIADTFISLSPTERKTYIAAISDCEQAKIYISFILKKVEKKYTSTERVNTLLRMVSDNPKELQPYISDMREMCLSEASGSVDSDYCYNTLAFLTTCEKRYGIPLKAVEISNTIGGYLQCLYAEHRDYNLTNEKATELKNLSQIYNIQRLDKVSANLAYVFLTVGEMKAHISDKGTSIFNGYNPIEIVDYDLLTPMQQQSLIETFSKQISEYWLNTKKLPHLQSIFTVRDASGEMKAYSYLFGEILDCVIDSGSKNRSDVMVAIIEYAIYLRLSQFLEDAPEMLVYKVKASDILKPLEKELELKTRLKEQKELLSEIDTVELQHQVAKIREAYDRKAQNSTLGRAKQAFGNLMSGFRKGKKDDQ